VKVPYTPHVPAGQLVVTGIVYSTSGTPDIDAITLIFVTSKAILVEPSTSTVISFPLDTGYGVASSFVTVP
jgi:hypothetical protein